MSEVSMNIEGGSGGGDVGVTGGSDFSFQNEGANTQGVSVDMSAAGHDLTFVGSSTTTDDGSYVQVQSYYENGEVVGSVFTIASDSGIDMYQSIHGEPAQLVGHQDYPGQ